MSWLLLVLFCLALAYLVRGLVRASFSVDPSSDYYLASVFGAAWFIARLI